MNQDLRRTEILKDGNWEPAQFRHLKKGDIFRLYEDDDEVVETEKGFIAMGDAHPTEDNPDVWGITAEERE